jgi:hypothetical protein
MGAAYSRSGYNDNNKFSRPRARIAARGGRAFPNGKTEKRHVPQKIPYRITACVSSPPFPDREAHQAFGRPLQSHEMGSLFLFFLG